MNKRRRRPIGFKRALQAIRLKLISNVLNRLKGDGSSGGEGRWIIANRHTGDRNYSCQMFVREGIKEKGGIPLLVIDAEVANTRED